MSKKEKFILELDELEDDFFDDASIIAIVCKEEPYHFIWNCNQLLNTQLKVYKGIPRDSILYNHTIYDFYDDKQGLQHYIYQLVQDNNALLPELKNFDFLWIIKGGDERLIYLEKIIEKIAPIKKLQIVTKLAEDKIKNKTLLII